VRSLRGRLTLGITVMLAVVLAGAGVMVSRYADRSERRALDDRLKATAELSRETSLASVQLSHPTPNRRLDQALSATRTSLRLLLGRRVLRPYGRPPTGDRPAARDGLRTFTAGGERYRSYVSGLEQPDGGLARLEVTTSLRGVEERMSALNRRLAAVGVAALLVAGAGVWFVANLLLRPLQRLRAATANIAGTEDLDRRVPDHDGAAELRSLAASFNDMLGRLGRSARDRERALAATRRFTADAGHELRTPLTSVQATLSALSRHPDIPAGQRAELVRDAASVAHTDVDLAELVATTVEGARTRHPDISWSSDLPADAVVVRGWEAGLRLLADNLLENAARHGRPGGSVAVSVVAGPTLVVDDDGPGVDEADGDRIFEPFVRANGTRVPGSGLGLTLVAQQVRDHGATVEVGRSPLGGARFSVRFG
jgi:two-component system sensor histidine kinase PrrB